MARTPALAAVAAVAAIALSACGFVGDGTDTYDAGSAAPVGGTGAKTLDPPPETILSANSTAQLGTVVIDGLGHTLYRFDEDSARPPTATCTDACASTWPPVVTDPGKTPILEGVNEDEVGTVERPDGSMQVTIGGWPVYRHAADSAAGATDGHGVSGAWFAVTPEGTKAAAP